MVGRERGASRHSEMNLQCEDVRHFGSTLLVQILNRLGVCASADKDLGMIYIYPV